MKSTTQKTLSRGLTYLGAGVNAWRMRTSSSELVRERAERHLIERLGRLRGLPQKMGQLLSMGDLDQQSGAFAELRANAEPVELEEILPVLAEGWGFDPQDVLAAIEPRGLAASLGQVHRAELQDGRDVAIKIQYPDISAALDTDLAALGWISKPIGNLRAGFDLDGYRRVIREGLEAELDYCAEAANQIEFKRLAVGLDISVPEVLEELSSERVLTTTWETGETLDEILDWSEQERSQLGMRLVEQFLEMGFVHGLLHGDPHPGNYRFRKTDEGPETVLYDFGCVCRLDESERLLLLRLIAESVDPASGADPFALLVGLGFDAELLEPLRHKLPAICRILFEPFASAGQYDYKQWQLSERLENALGSDRLNFRIAGPPRLMHFLRAFAGLAHVLKRLDVPVFWSGPLQRLLARRAPDLLQVRVPEVAPSSASFACLAKNLCIRVSQDGVEKVSLKLPAGAVERLAEMLDEDLSRAIAQRGIDVAQLVRNVREKLYAPQQIFTLEDQGKRVEVSLV